MQNISSKIIDLTQSLSAEIASWDGDCGFNLAIETDYTDCSGPDVFRVNKITTRAGMGTHIDSPAHCFAGSNTVEKIGLETLVTDFVLIEIEENADEKYLVMPELVIEFERLKGRIKPNTFVIFNTRWGKKWNLPNEYRNNLEFPSIHPETARLLLDRQVAGLGSDTLSADAGGKDFPVHRAMLGANKYLVENIFIDERLPAIGAKILIMPMKIEGATEAPVRIAALVD